MKKEMWGVHRRCQLASVPCLATVGRISCLSSIADQELRWACMRGSCRRLGKGGLATDSLLGVEAPRLALGGGCMGSAAVRASLASKQR
ncbi:hypothetical protein TIFTF001_028532 [Ficus carica]|uniref:Uncharacterized protein n=1 Tax=Ficus carica TaxID=3494 RepID=A0AA88IWN2_FICCA|nr:hypothetical protein TIFTF001_028532 [Ficus carica]